MANFQNGSIFKNLITGNINLKINKSPSHEDYKIGHVILGIYL